MVRRSVVFALVVSGLALLAPIQARGQREGAVFQTLARGTCAPLPGCALPQRGVISCPGGEEISTGAFPPWCSEGSRTKVRGRMLRYGIVQTTDQRVAGDVTMLFNMNLESSTFRGPFWGSYTIELPERGAWEGMVEGKAQGPGLWIYKVVLFGTGEFKGLQIRADGVWQAGVGDRLEGKIVEDD